MLLSDVVPEGGRIWLKSEWEPAGDNCPAVSFSKRSVGELLGRELRPQQDALIYVGTSNPNLTKDPTHRQRLLSAMKIEPEQFLETRECVSPASWERAQQDFRWRWYWSMPALEMWSIEGFPRASDVVPQSYSQLGLIENRGNVVEVVPHEKAAILKLGLRRIPFEPARRSADFGKTRNFWSLSVSIRSEISRMASGIVGRVERSGTPAGAGQSPEVDGRDGYQHHAGSSVGGARRPMLSVSGAVAPRNKKPPAPVLSRSNRQSGHYLQRGKHADYPPRLQSSKKQSYSF